MVTGVDETIGGTGTAGRIEGAGIDGTIGGAGTIEGTARAIGGAAGTKHNRDGEITERGITEHEITERTTASGTEGGAIGHGRGAAEGAVPIETRVSEDGAGNAEIRSHVA